MSASAQLRAAPLRLVALVTSVAIAAGACGGPAGAGPAASGSGTAGAPTARGAATADPAVSASPGATSSPTSPAPTSSPLAPSPTAPPAGVPEGYVSGTINGTLIPVAEAERATRHPISVMVDDQAAARPQSGLSTADLVIQAPAEGGIPRYLAFFQAGDAESIGPIRSTRLYYIGWAAEWKALYAHVGGAPNALKFLSQVDKRLVYNAEEFHWGPSTGYMVRIRERVPPHNVYSSSALLFKLADHLGADVPVDQPAWTFIDDVPYEARPVGGTVLIPFPYNRVVMKYDRSTNRYLRTVSGERLQVDAATGQPVAPRNVIVQFVKVGRLPNTSDQGNNIAKGRLEIGYIGSGRAIVMRNGEVIEATWSKKSDAEPTLFRYATGPQKGHDVPLVRGQILIEVVPREFKVVTTPGKPAVPQP